MYRDVLKMQDELINKAQVGKAVECFAEALKHLFCVLDDLAVYVLP